MKKKYIAFKGFTSNIFVMGEHIQVTEINISSPYSNYKLNKNIIIDPYCHFSLGSPISLTGISTGKGFCGVIKRYGFSSGNKSHGNSKSHNKPGSIGMCQDPGRVFKGKKMPGHKGFSNSHKMNLRIVLIEKNRIIIKGCIPGSFGSRISIRL
ncbi:50S ribosomal protein L3 [Candidatus Vidania fulgoroideae]|uniref:Large ribosomal subunit protein uL3 n=1 Tax=Candidatus Vidania fulgoroideorum TaxID=881286 RepID=A0A975ADV8_9PROT|nr:50S ribosomal protein L3 [Candidatus Vidania fulgoroideae]